MREKRDEILILRITKSEKSRIYEKMLSMGIRSLSAYIRKMALDGYCLHAHGSFPFSLQRPSGRTVFAYIAKRGLTAIVYVTKNFGFRRGEIYFADLDPHYGSEQGGKRPVIIIQNDVGNKFAPTVIVAAVTSRISKKPNQPTHVLIDKNPAFSRPSVVLLEQIFTIDKERINNFMGLTSEWEMKQIEEALLKSLGMNK